MPERFHNVSDGGQALIVIVDTLVELTELTRNALAKGVRVVRLLRNRLGRGSRLSLVLLNLSRPSGDGFEDLHLRAQEGLDVRGRPG